jgi:hypothetical protein
MKIGIGASPCHIGSMIGGNVPSSLLTGLAAFWKLEDLSDQGPNGLTLTNNNAATFVAGKIGNAVQLVAASNQFLSRADNAVLRASSSASIMASCWVKPTTIQAVAGCMNKGSPTFSTGGEWGLESVSGVWRLVLRNTGDSSSQGVNSTVTMTSGNWYHVLGWWDASGKTINISVNGETPVSLSFPTGGFSGTSALNIGYWVAGGTRFNGLIDAAGIWNRIPAAGESALLYNSGNGREYPF